MNPLFPRLFLCYRHLYCSLSMNKRDSLYCFLFVHSTFSDSRNQSVLNSDSLAHASNHTKYSDFHNILVLMKSSVLYRSNGISFIFFIIFHFCDHLGITFDIHFFFIFSSISSVLDTYRDTHRCVAHIGIIHSIFFSVILSFSSMLCTNIFLSSVSIINILGIHFTLCSRSLYGTLYSSEYVTMMCMSMFSCDMCVMNK